MFFLLDFLDILYPITLSAITEFFRYSALLIATHISWEIIQFNQQVLDTFPFDLSDLSIALGVRVTKELREHIKKYFKLFLLWPHQYNLKSDNLVDSPFQWIWSVKLFKHKINFLNRKSGPWRWSATMRIHLDVVSRWFCATRAKPSSWNRDHIEPTKPKIFIIWPCLLTPVCISRILIWCNQKKCIGLFQQIQMIISARPPHPHSLLSLVASLLPHRAIYF